MMLLTKELKTQLIRNGEQMAQALDFGDDQPDHMPVVKLFTPDAACTWLLTEIDPGDPDIAFGLCDLGMGFPELGSVRISELESVRGRLGLPVERDLYFKAAHSVSIYARAARNAAAITECPQALAQAVTAAELEARCAS